MTRQSAAIFLSLLFASGCIFGGGKPPKENNGDVETNNATSTNNETIATNNGTAATNNGTAATNNVMSTNNRPTSSAALDPVDAVVTCGGTPRAPVMLTSSTLTGLRNGAVAGLGTPPGPGVFQARDGDATIAWAQVGNGEAVVRAGTLAFGDMGGDPSVSRIGEATFETGLPGELFGLTVAGKVQARTTGEPAPFYEVLVFSSEGIYKCTYGVPEWNETDSVVGACEVSPFQEIAAMVDLDPLTDFAALFELPDFTLNLFNVGAARNVIFGADRAGDSSDLGAIWYTSQSVESFDLGQDIETSQGLGRTFSPYASLGVIEESHGLPIMTVLASGTDGGEYKPRVLTANAPKMRATAYRVWEESADWSLFGTEQLSDETFAFVDATTANGEISFFGDVPSDIVVYPEQSEARLGYLAVSEVPERLILGPMEPVLGKTHLRVELDAPVQEIVTAPNIVVQPQKRSSPFIAIIAGDDRDRLYLGTWDVGSEMRLVEIAEASELTNVTNVTPPILFYASGGRVVINGTYQGEAAVGLLNIQDVANPQTEYCD